MDAPRTSLDEWIRRATAGAPIAWILALAAGACSSGSASSPGAFTEASGGPASVGASNEGTSATGANSSSGGAALPAEMKVESNFLSPVATGSVVWVANPSSGRVAYVDATKFNVKTVQAGAGPTYLAAIPDPIATDQPPDDLAIVINVASQSASLFTLAPPPDGGPDVDGTLTTRTFGSIPPYANAWAVSSSGRWAIAWTNTSPGVIANPDPLQAYSDIAVIDVTGQRPPTLLASVGPLPVQVAFAGDAYAYVVTQGGIAVVDLLGGAAPMVTVTYPLQGASDAGDADGAAAPSAADGGTPADDAADNEVAAVDAGASSGPDVSFTPDAAYALVRQDGVQSISVIALATGITTTVPLPALPTDLTISPTGTFAVAVLRDTSTVVTLPIPEIASDPTAYATTSIAGQTIGRAIVTGGGETALLFTTAAPVDALTVLTFQPSPTYHTIRLLAPVLAVFPTPDADDAIVLHQITPTTQDQGAFSVVPISAEAIAKDLQPNTQALTAPPLQVAVADDRALVTVSDPATATYGVYTAVMPSLLTVDYPLASAPLAVGVMPGSGSAYVSQDYPDGRITFIGLGEDDGGARTITGFDLSAGIVEGTEQ